MPNHSSWCQMTAAWLDAGCPLTCGLPFGQLEDLVVVDELPFEVVQAAHLVSPSECQSP